MQHRAFTRGIAQNGALSLIQTLPTLPAHGQHFRHIGMFRCGVEFRHFEMPRAFIGWPIVFRAINHAGLQAGEDLTKGQRRRVGTHGAHDVDPKVRGLHTDFHAAHIGRRAHRAHCVNAARPRIIPGKGDDADRFQIARNILPDRAIHHAMAMANIAEQEGQSQNGGGRCQVVQRREIEIGEINRAKAHLLNGFILLAKLRGMEGAHANAVIGALTHQLRKAVHAAAIRVIGGVNIPAAPFLRRNLSRRECHERKRSRGHGTEQAAATGF